MLKNISYQRKLIIFSSIFFFALLISGLTTILDSPLSSRTKANESVVEEILSFGKGSDNYLRVIKSPAISQKQTIKSDHPNTEGWIANVADSWNPTAYTPLLADLNNDGDQEIIIKSGNHVHALKIDGSELPGWPQTMVNALLGTVSQPSVAVADIDQDGQLDVVAGWVSWGNDPGCVYVWSGNGTLKPGWPVKCNAPVNQVAWVGMGATALKDLNGDGNLEIIGTSHRLNKVFVWKHDGQPLPGWPKTIESYTRAGFRGLLNSPAIADLNNDGHDDIIVGYESANITPSGLYAWNSQGIPISGYPLLGIYGFSPLAIDIDVDKQKEIALTFDDKMSFIRQNGNFFGHWPVYDSTWFGWTPISVGDLEGGGQLEVAFATQGGNIYLTDKNGSPLPGWPKSTGGLARSHITLADLDNDQVSEIIATVGNSLYIWYKNGTIMHDYPKTLLQLSSSGAAVADIDADGQNEVVVADLDGNVYVYKIQGLEGAKTNLVIWPSSRRTSHQLGTYEKMSYPNILTDELPRGKSDQSYEASIIGLSISTSQPKITMTILGLPNGFTMRDCGETSSVPIPGSGGLITTTLECPITGLPGKNQGVYSLRVILRDNFGEITTKVLPLVIEP